MYDEDAFRADERIFDMGIPILGICYGMQLMTTHFGGKVERAKDREYGKADIHVENPSRLFASLPTDQVVWMSHGDLVVEEPAGFEVTATSKSCPIAGIADEDRLLYGVQFHPEVRHSVHGNELLKNFALNVCGCKGDWTMENFSEVEIAKIQEIVGDKKSCLHFLAA